MHISQSTIDEVKALMDEREKEYEWGKQKEVYERYIKTLRKVEGLMEFLGISGHFDPSADTEVLEEIQDYFRKKLEEGWK